MNITSVGNLSELSRYGTSSLSTAKGTNNATFEDIFQAAKSMVKETNDLTSAAQEAETSFALGKTNNTYALQEAQQKANLSLQYTIAVRNSALDAYKEIMNLQF